MALIGSGSGPSPWKADPDGTLNAVMNNVLTIAAAANLFQKTIIPADGFTYVLPTNHQFILFDNVTIDGDLTLDGDLVLLG